MSPHQPTRPAWRCAACHEEWPCPQGRDEMRAEADGNRLELALLMARYFGEAIKDHPTPMIDVLYARFFGWVRWRTERTEPE
jgi:hypothetical protein